MPQTRASAPNTLHHSPRLGHNGTLPDPLVDLVVRRRFTGRREFENLSRAFGPLRRDKTAADISASVGGGAADFLFLTDHDPHAPEDVFDRLRWGGQLILVSRNPKLIATAVHAYETWRMDQADHAAWLVEQPLGIERQPFLRFFRWRAPVHFMTARKIMLVPPGKSSDRFTYHVHLEKSASGNGYEVVKEVPTVERVAARLREKFPDADEITLRRRARKFTDKIFPVFLTRETAILKLLQRDLPPRFRDRVPHVISGETDSIGYVRTLRMNWLRNARPIKKAGTGRGSPHQPAPLSQLEFAHQAAELLTALHDKAGIMHLDLRLDNVVITEQGVSFVDFGSSVRVGEEFPEASLLSNLFDEMMRTSQIQRMLGKMTETGQITSEEITSSHQRIDKAVDFFYLALQINNPLSNPDFRGLVDFDPLSAQAKELTKLTEKILRPQNPDSPEFTSAKHILQGIEEIEKRL